MNDEEVIFQSQGPSDSTESDPLPQTDETAWDEDGGEAPSNVLSEDAISVEPDVEDPDLLADPLPDSDPDSGAHPSAGTSDGLELLRSELSRLQAELALREERLERLGTEYTEFCQLYPEISPEELSDAVWQDVRRGIPLAAAYALAERKRVCAVRQAKQSNLKNQMRSAGEIRLGEDDVYSPAEVRAMTPAEVRANYSKIMRSMQKWH